MLVMWLGGMLFYVAWVVLHCQLKRTHASFFFCEYNKAYILYQFEDQPPHLPQARPYVEHVCHCIVGKTCKKFSMSAVMQRENYHNTHSLPSDAPMLTKAARVDQFHTLQKLTLPTRHTVIDNTVLYGADVIYECRYENGIKNRRGSACSRSRPTEKPTNRPNDRRCFPSESFLLQRCTSLRSYPCLAPTPECWGTWPAVSEYTRLTARKLLVARARTLQSSS